MLLECETKSKGKMIIKTADESDSTAIYDLALIASKDDSVPDIFKDMGENIISKTEEGDVKSTLVAYIDDELVGVLDVEPEGDHLRLVALYVRRDYRRQRIASCLVDALDKYVGGKKLMVTAVSEEGVRFWKNKGYYIKSSEMAKN